MLKTVSSVINAIGALNYVGTWNASTNTPALASGVGTKGNYYVVSTAGSTSLDGQSLWGVGDWAVFNGTAWQKVDGGSTTNVDSVTSVNNITSTAGNFVPSTSGKGMDFSAVTPGAGVSSQLFDDYQEGSGTAGRDGFTEVPGGGTITSTYHYTKIGRTVFMNIRLTCSGGAQIGAPAAASAAFTNLPFTVASGQQSTGTWMDTTGYSVFGPTSMVSTNMYVGGPGFALGSNSYSFSAVFNV